MEKYNFSYDEEHDDLFIYSGEKSKGSIELGDFVFDFNKEGKLVAFQILNASKTLSKLAEKTLYSLKLLKECQMNVVNMRNVFMIKLTLFYENGKIETTLFAPKVTETSPALEY